MIVYLDGEYVDAGAARVSIFDGGYLFGDGLFETLRLYQGRPFALSGHLARLERQLALLNYNWRPDAGQLREIFRQLCLRNDLLAVDCRVRLTVSRGADPSRPLPLADLASLAPTVSVFVSPLAVDLGAWQRDGIGVRVMQAAFARGNFPQLKTLNYLPTVLALRFAAAHGCPEALLVDRRGQVLEGATSNVFVGAHGRLLTPPVSLGLLPGLTRQHLLDLAGRLGLPWREEVFRREDLEAADEVFLCGSVKEIVPIVRVDDAAVSGGRPGPITRRLQTAYRQDVRDALAEEAAAP